ncbi:hypothetical protein E2562_014160 [Oryza meyeriana var. granulata]|uniref:Uncharacterized protein n=1 Tax=Oryza meyeriana var. granulata TaxID=110450 RepID=A0A6G1BJ04_9ORYZ|nr:hypothetical protein E2562_014160 [Oryza meyeriana var. granulata]
MSRRSRLSWLWRAPARALGRARDMYVRGLTGCARCVPADAAFGYPVFVPSGSMRSNSFGSEWGGGGGRAGGGGGADDDLRELIRAASQRRAAEQAREAQAVARSQSMVGLSMARIDEDAPCEEFGGAGVMQYPRSQSCVGGRAGGRIAHCQRKVATLA